MCFRHSGSEHTKFHETHHRICEFAWNEIVKGAVKKVPSTFGLGHKIKKNTIKTATTTEKKTRVCEERKLKLERPFRERISCECVVTIVAPPKDINISI